VLRTAGDLRVTGTLASTGARADADASAAGDVLFAAAPTVLSGALSLADGSHVDVKTTTGAVRVDGGATADTDARFQAGGTATVAGLNAGRDIFVDGSTASTGALDARRDIAVRGGAGGVTIAVATAGDDIAVRSAGGTVAGALTSGAVPGADGAGVADRLIAETGPIRVGPVDFALGGGGDVDIRSGSMSLRGGVSALGAGSDARLQATGAVETAGDQRGSGHPDRRRHGGERHGDDGALTAARDVGVRSGATATLASVRRGTTPCCGRPAT
jgi:hypothetical protein